MDDNGTIYIGEGAAVSCLSNDGAFKWRKGRNALQQCLGRQVKQMENSITLSQTIGQDGNLYVTDHNNHRVQVLDKNGTFIRKFGEYGSAPGQLNTPLDVVSLADGRILVTDYNYSHFFKMDGTFIKRESGSTYASVASDGMLYSNWSFSNSDGQAFGSQYIFPCPHLLHPRGT